MKADLLLAARVARAPQELIDAILAADSDAELAIYRDGLIALLGQKIQRVADALEARGQRVQAARARATGRAAEAEWEKHKHA